MQIRSGGRVLSLCILLMIMLAGCQIGRGGGAEDVSIQLDLPPNRSGEPAAVTATITDASGAPIDGADVTLRGDMTHAGMEPVITPLTAAGNGQYRSDAFEMTMAGDWVLTVEATLPDGRRAEEAFPLNGVE
jgi:hypothetical protein